MHLISVIGNKGNEGSQKITDSKIGELLSLKVCTDQYVKDKNYTLSIFQIDFEITVILAKDLKKNHIG